MVGETRLFQAWDRGKIIFIDILTLLFDNFLLFYFIFDIRILGKTE